MATAQQSVNQLFDDLKKGIYDVELKSLNSSIKLTKKLKILSIAIIVMSLFFIPVSYLSNNYFNLFIWSFNFAYQIYSLKNNKGKIAELETRKMEILKDNDYDKYIKLQRQKKFKNLNIKSK